MSSTYKRGVLGDFLGVLHRWESGQSGRQWLSPMLPDPAENGHFLRSVLRLHFAVAKVKVL